MNSRRTAILVAVTEAVVIQLAITIETSRALQRDALFGAPLAVGRTGTFNFFHQTTSSFDLGPFLANIAITALIFVLLVRVTGLGGSVVATAGWFAALMIAGLMYGEIGRQGRPWAGFPIPVAHYSEPGINRVLLWLDGLIFAVVLAAVWRLGNMAIRWRHRRSRGVS